jgi:heptose I phosphotransferase
MKRFWRGIRTSIQRDDWPHFAGNDWLEQIMDIEVTDRFHAKQGRSTGRLILHQDDLSLAVYLKRHYRLSRWRGLLATLWPEKGRSPALQEWRNLEEARKQGLLVPKNVAAGEIIGPWCKFQSFLAVEELSGMLPLHEAIPLAKQNLEAPRFQVWKCGLVSEVARVVRKLHERRYFHKDLYLCHLYIPEEMCLPDTTYKAVSWSSGKHLYLIDLHRLARHRFTWPLWQVKDLAQLAYSSEIEGIDARDRLAFWRAYGRGRPGSALFNSWLQSAIQLKWRRYRRHNAKKRAASLLTSSRTPAGEQLATTN